MSNKEMMYHTIEEPLLIATLLLDMHYYSPDLLSIIHCIVFWFCNEYASRIDNACGRTHNNYPVAIEDRPLQTELESPSTN